MRKASVLSSIHQSVTPLEKQMQTDDLALACLHKLSRVYVCPWFFCLGFLNRLSWSLLLKKLQASMHTVRASEPMSAAERACKASSAKRANVRADESMAENSTCRFHSLPTHRAMHLSLSDWLTDRHKHTYTQTHTLWTRESIKNAKANCTT